MIALLCPTRGRMTQYYRMCASAKMTAEKEGNVCIHGCTNGKEIYVQNMPDDAPTVYMWNELAKQALENPDNKLFMLAADDMIFSTHGWDKALIDHYNALENKIHVYALQDSRDSEGTPHPIVTREYIDALGYFMPPLFLHWYCDTWTVEIAKANNCFTHLRGYQLIHDKPSDNGQADETHNRIRSMGWRERDKAVNDSCHHFQEIEKVRLYVTRRGGKVVNTKADATEIEAMVDRMVSTETLSVN